MGQALVSNEFITLHQGMLSSVTCEYQFFLQVYSKGQSDPTLKREPAKENPSSRWKFYDSVKVCVPEFFKTSATSIFRKLWDVQKCLAECFVTHTCHFSNVCFIFMIVV